MVLCAPSRKRSTSCHADYAETAEDGAFKYQVGGHHELTRYDRAHIAKPSCAAETLFYLEAPMPLRDLVPHLCAYSESINHPLRPSTSSMCDSCAQNGVPLFFRTPDSPTARRKSAKNDETYVILSDLTAGYRKPSVIDLKMGTQQHGDNAAPDKVRRHSEKCARSTSLQWGLRLCGLRYYNAVTGHSSQVDKYAGRTIPIAELWHSVRGFLAYPNGELRIAVIRSINEQLQRIQQAVRNLDGVRLFGSSLLIIYEGDTLSEPMSDEEADSLVSVHIVDFANATLANGAHDGPDQGFLLGLRSLQSFIASLLQSPYAEDGDSESSASPQSIDDF